MNNISIFPDPQKLATAVADRIIEVGKIAIQTKGVFTLVLAGGSTPKTAYQLLASEKFSTQLNWSMVHIFWGDERSVPPDHKDSNYRMAKEALLDQVPLPKSNIHRIEGEHKPSDAASRYVILLNAFFETTPRFDLIMLGMGEDGHTASLFPGTDAVLENHRWCVSCYIDKLATWRITLTPLVINQAQNIIFVISGENKAKPLKQVLSGKYQPEILPSQIIKPVNGEITWFIDQAAARLLD